MPENISLPAYSGLEETMSVHLQAFRIGDILFTLCSCEQWHEQSKNIKTRTNRTQGDSVERLRLGVRAQRDETHSASATACAPRC